MVAILGGLCANIGLMKLNVMHQGCANVCTLCQFAYGLSEVLSTPSKRKFLLDSKERLLPMPYHLLFSTCFFLGPYLGNQVRPCAYLCL